MKILTRIGCVVAIVLGFTGCTTMPPVDFTVQDVGPMTTRKDASMLSLTVGFAPKAQQDKVDATGITHVAPIWKEALQDALNRSLAFRDGASKKVNLSVRITRFDVPVFGGTMRTKVGAIYEIIDRSSGDLLFTEKIESVGEVGMDFAFVGAVRAVESWNRGVRNNIATFLNKLEEADLQKPVFKGKDS